MILLIATFVVGIILIYHLRWKIHSNKVVYVVVLGDIGRSPRMQYHALSLAKSQRQVLLIGFPGSKPHNEVLSNKFIQLVHLPMVPSMIKGLPSPFNFVVQVLVNAIMLFACLVYHARPTHILVQNPPSIPSMMISWMVCRLRNCRLVYDWHNYGYTIMALNNNNSPLVGIYKWYEKLFGKFSDDNICVTESMKEDLKINWNIRATTLYDRSPSFFKKLNESEKKIFIRSSQIFGESSSDELGSNRHALVLSSTSWTPDEDFGILLEALDIYNKETSSSSNLPSVLCVVTGKGPLKEHYKSLIEAMNWSKVKVITPWLEAEDYPLLLGSGDLGVCLHTSSSGLDLPMKVVDMFGCGLPVCAVHYNCINELVEEGVTGVTFKSARQLAEQLMDMLRDFPDGCITLKKLKMNVGSMIAKDWQSNWIDNVKHIFE